MSKTDDGGDYPLGIKASRQPWREDPEECPICKGPYYRKFTATDAATLSQSGASQEFTCVIPVRLPDGSMGMEMFFHMDELDGGVKTFIIENNPLYRTIMDAVGKGGEVTEASILGAVTGDGDWTMEEAREGIEDLRDGGYVEKKGDGVYEYTEAWRDEADV